MVARNGGRGRLQLSVLARAMYCATLALISCADNDKTAPQSTYYLSLSRFTDPGAQSTMLDILPPEPLEIAEVAKNLTVHHNLLPYLGVAKEEWPQIQSIWPPKMSDALAALSKSGPGNLLGTRQVKEKLRGACMSESHLLAAMLRHQGIPVRIRAGYFRNVYTNEEHVIAFWEKNARAKGIAQDLLDGDPQRWVEVNHENTRAQLAVNKCIEHWAAEYWDDETQTWRLLDANNTFLKAMSDIEIGFLLPRRYFEFAYESWQQMRTAPHFNPDQYAEWPQDGRSHIRAQLLWDFYSLLNHDIAGYDKSAWPEEGAVSAERDAYAFVKETRFEDVPGDELSELDQLAELLSTDPSVGDLVAFYLNSQHLRLSTLEEDPHSFPAKRDVARAHP